MDDNPFQPPAADVNEGRQRRGYAGDAPASRGFRLLAALVDWFVFLSFIFLAAILSGTSYTYNHSLGAVVAFVAIATRSTLGWGLLLAWLAANALQAYGIATTGQSLGKRVLHMKIVRLDGQSAGFVRGVVLRCGLVFVVTILVPFGLGLLLYFADALFVVRADRRCLHDLIAGTRVRELYASEESSQG